jgi:hypothetical protein
MKYLKTIVCFANSRKTAGRCLAGKEWNNSTAGAWVRPVSARSSHEISEEERRYDNGRTAQILDIISIPCERHEPVSHQQENHLIDPEYYWTKKGRLSWNDKDVISGGCLLCSEATPEHCHRRLVAEYFQRHWADVCIQHL